jgi:hypothetical protein
MNVGDKLHWKSKWRIDKFYDSTGEIKEALRRGISVEEAVKLAGAKYLGSEVFDGNIALNEGLQELIDIICGLGTPTKWDATNARLGVGDSNAAENASQTGLQGTNKAFKSMDSGYPTRSNQTAEWRATFGSAEANFAWNEFTVVNAADDTGKNLNRKVAAKGTKSSGETWTLSLQITFS